MITWNYRIGTRKATFSDFDINVLENRRIFRVIECKYVDAEIAPRTYIECTVLSGGRDYESLKQQYEFISEAFSQPVLDLDNWPNVYQP